MIDCKIDEHIKKIKGFLIILRTLDKDEDENRKKSFSKDASILFKGDLIWDICRVAHQYEKQDLISHDKIEEGILDTYDFIMDKFKNYLLEKGESKLDVIEAVLGSSK